jgi:hypothetical protein
MVDNTNSKNLGRTPLVPKYINNRIYTPIRLDKNEKNVDVSRKLDFKNTKPVVDEEVEKDFSNMVYGNNGFNRFSLDNYEGEWGKEANYGNSHTDCQVDPYDRLEIEVKEFAVDIGEYEEMPEITEEFPNCCDEFFNSHVKFVYITKRDVDIESSIKDWLDEGLFYSEII